MRFEVSKIFNNCLEEHLASASYLSEPYERDALRDLLPITLEDCRPKIGSAFTTAICFELVSRLRELRSESENSVPTPLQIAEELVAPLLHDSSCKFDWEIGGLGHINVSPSSKVIAEFLQAINESNEFLFADALGYSPLRVGDVLGEVACEELVVDWNSVLKRASKKGGDDVQSFISLRSLSSLSAFH